MAFDPVAFVAQHGVVLGSAHGPVPNIAEAVAGSPIRGSWWGHKKGAEIFQALSKLYDAPNVLCFQLVGGKVTFVHRRLWPALVRLAKVLGSKKLTAIRQEHTPSGAHRNVLTPFPKWVPQDVLLAARTLTEAKARGQLGNWIEPTKAARRDARETGRRSVRRPGRV